MAWPGLGCQRQCLVAKTACMDGPEAFHNMLSDMPHGRRGKALIACARLRFHNRRTSHGQPALYSLWYPSPLPLAPRPETPTCEPWRRPLC